MQPLRIIASTSILDRFSNTEISALMFHGYTCLDASLRKHSDHWIPSGAPEPKFHSADEAMNIDWADWSWADFFHEIKTHTNFVRHLHASNSRSALWRQLCRFRNRWRGSKSFERETSWVPRALQRKARKKRLKHPPKFFAPSSGRTPPQKLPPLGPGIGHRRQQSTSSPKSEPNAK
jgi:hypothetical protein